MELRNFRFKLPTLPEPKQRKRRITDEVSTPEDSTPRSKRLASRLQRLEATRDLPSPMQRKRMERRQTEIRKRRDEIDFDMEDLGHEPYVSARTFHRQLFSAVLKADEDRVKEVLNDSRMHIDAATTQYAYADDRTPIVEAFASENCSLIMALLQNRNNKKSVGIDHNLLEPICYNSPLLTQLVRRNVPYSIIEKFRPVSLYLERDELELGDGVCEIIRKAHEVIGHCDGEFYTVEEYGSASVKALRFGHCILALNLARKKGLFASLTEEIITSVRDAKESFSSNEMMYQRSNTSPYFLSIHAAAARGRDDVLEWYYTQYSIALNLMDEGQWTALHYAAVSEDPRALKWILAKGGKLTCRNKQGQTPLHVAVQAGRVENIKILSSSLEALDRLCLNSDHLSLENRSSLNWKTKEKLSALHIAAGRGNLEIVKALCRHPFIDVNSKNKEGLTPIMVAASRGHIKCVEFLSKSCINQVDHLDRNVLIHASINGQTKALYLLLKSTTITHDSLDTCNNSALHYACSYGWMNIVKMLIDSTMLIQQNREGLTPVECAFRNGHFGIILWLISNGYDKFVNEDPNSQENVQLQEVVGEWMAARYDGFSF